MNNITAPDIRIAITSSTISDFAVFSRGHCFNLRGINITLEDIKIYFHRIRISALLPFIRFRVRAITVPRSNRICTKDE